MFSATVYLHDKHTYFTGRARVRWALKRLIAWYFKSIYSRRPPKQYTRRRAAYARTFHVCTKTSVLVDARMRTGEHYALGACCVRVCNTRVGR